MGEKITICVGCVGSGMFVSQDGGDSWRQSVMKMPFAPWAPWVQIRAVAVSPHDPRTILAGSEVGLHRSRDGGLTYEFVPSPADRHQIWSIAVHPREPGVIFVGAAPFDGQVNIIRTRDDGETWDVLDVPAPSRSLFGAAHITGICFDPRDDRRIWASCEVGGVYESPDGGDSWRQVREQLGDTPVTADVHAVQATPYGRLFATTPDGLWTSEDDGAHFELHRFEPVPEPEPVGVPFGILAYARGITPHAAEPDTLFVGTGDYTPGKYGMIQRSTDRGRTWSKVSLSEPANSHFYTIAAHPADPSTLVAATMFGNIFVSRDAGESWRKLSREFGEVRGLAWTPTIEAA